jgi:hypothetical protein
MENQGFIEPSTSPYSSCVVLVKKKDGTPRFCLDFRDLNAITQPDAYQIPSVDSILRVFDQSIVFTTLDLQKGYWQVLLEEDSKQYTAFQTPLGLFQWVVMPMGLKNASMTFQRVMNDTLRGLVGKFVQVYLDDIVVYSTSLQEHAHHLDQVLQRLKTAGFTLQVGKCRFAMDTVDCLGHVIGHGSINPQPEKLLHIKQFPQPMKKKDVRKFLGTTNWYLLYVQD